MKRILIVIFTVTTVLLFGFFMLTTTQPFADNGYKGKDKQKELQKLKEQDKEYQKAVDESIKCFEYFIELNSHHDANMCLQTWKMHAKEIDRFDESNYQELVKQINALKEKQSE